eukprot:c19754_g1_i1.p1 GENE.c19754_g1_i1~~c19754_g1_i1.p1  ORF type:complete len:685 (+),score=185.62 c19754_g1_i1:22-2076(+)
MSLGSGSDFDEEDELSGEDVEVEGEGADDEERYQELLSLIQKTSQKQKDRPQSGRAAQQSAYGTESAAAAVASSEVSLGKLLEAAGDTPNLGELRKRLIKMTKAAERDKVVEAPSRPAAERSVRQAATAHVKREVAVWEPIIKRTRESESLRFPLHDVPVPNVTTRSLVATFTPETDLEVQVAQLLEQNKALTEASLLEREKELMLERAISPDEVKERQAELRKLRCMLFYQEQRSKRLKKIKSKKFRKLLKKKRQSAGQLSLEELAELDPELAAEERDKQERLRSLERVSLRHHTTGRWARAMIKRGFTKDADSRAAIQEQLRLGTELKQKMRSATGSSDDEDGQLEGVVDAANGVNQTLQAAKDWVLDSATEPETPKKGLHSLKFMQRAAEKKKSELENELAEWESAVNDVVENTDDASAIAQHTESVSGTQHAKRSKTALSGPVTIGALGLNLESTTEQDEDASGEDKEHVTENNSGSIVTIATTAPSQPKGASKKRKQGNENGTSQTTGATSQSEGGAQPTKKQKQNNKAKKENQEALIAEAFGVGGDEDEFRRTKKRQAEEENPVEIPETMPGWGAWAGTGVKPRKQSKRHSDLKQKRKKAFEKRKDASLDHVIINERVDKKVRKFTVPSLPHPFKSEAEYARATQQPIGADWNTETVTKRATRPKVRLVLLTLFSSFG